MLYEALSSDLDPRAAATKIAARSMELAAAAAAAGALGAWHVVSVSFPYLGPSTTALSGLVGLVLVVAALVLRRRPPRSLVERIARRLPSAGRRMLSLPAVGAIALVSLLFVWYGGPLLIPAPSATSATGSSTTWHKHVSAAGRFSVDVLGDAAESSGAAGAVVVHTFVAKGRGGLVTFIGQWLELPRDLTDLEKVYDNTRDSELAVTRGVVADEQRISWLAHSARQARIRVGDTSVVVRWIAVGGRLYAAKVVFAASHPADADVERFYSSWRFSP